MATVNTTWVSPASASLDKATGATIDETMTDGWSSDLYHLGGTAGYIGCRAYSNANQSIPSGVSTALTYNVELFDSDPNGAIHDNTTNSERMTIRTAGVYHCVANVRWASSATGFRTVQIVHSSGILIALASQNAVSGSQTDFSVSGSYSFAASEYCYVNVVQNTGGALNVEAFSASPSLSVVKA